MKFMFKAAFSLFFTIFFGACRPSYSPTPIFTSYNDLEDSYGWFNFSEHNAITLEKGNSAYSGQYFVRIKKGQDYGYFYKVKLEDITEKKISWIKYSFMGKKISGGIESAGIICVVSDSLNNNKAWMDIPLKFELIERNKWKKISGRFSLAKDYNPKNNVALFIWTKATYDEILQDDIKIEFFE